MSDLQLGPYTQGEVADPVEVQFVDNDGNPINITGYAVRFVYRERAATAATEKTGALIDAAVGKAGYTWVAADLATAGDYEAHLWVGNGTRRYASKRIHYRIHSNLGTTPTI